MEQGLSKLEWQHYIVSHLKLFLVRLLQILVISLWSAWTTLKRLIMIFTSKDLYFPSRQWSSVNSNVWLKLKLIISVYLIFFGTIGHVAHGKSTVEKAYIRCSSFVFFLLFLSSNILLFFLFFFFLLVSFYIFRRVEYKFLLSHSFATLFSGKEASPLTPIKLFIVTLQVKSITMKANFMQQ